MAVFWSNLQSALGQGIPRVLPFDYLIFSTMFFSIIVYREDINRITITGWDTSELREFAPFVFNISLLVASMAVFSIWHISETPQHIQERRETGVIILFILSILQLFSREISDELWGKISAYGSIGLYEIFHTILLSAPAVIMTFAIFFLFRYSPEFVNHASIFGVSLAMVVLFREGVRKRRARLRTRKGSVEQPPESMV